jgi:hypothetical protein
VLVEYLKPKACTMFVLACVHLFVCQAVFMILSKLFNCK